MKTKTLQLLNLTKEQYEEKTLNTYLDWCATRTTGIRSLQKALTCQPLFNWWQRELEKLELEFIQDMEELNQQDTQACMQAYNFIIRKIYDRFSKPLIQKAYDS